ncbi:GNAT family N-acetyltransferase [Telluria beijingensis]|uniref:GNAT family N-acetyltransferase n=1 Tax=Telluria beijingensis TaxID=3068633 RepID=UPI0027955D35|nr:GNAT family N-acetyltransferase [Massilia sp. REN29]
MSARCLGGLEARAPGPADEAFLATLYLETRPDLAALPVPRGVIEGIACHQRQMQVDDYARRYPALEDWLLLEARRPVGRVALDRAGGGLRVVDLSVATAARRRGIARAVLAALQVEHEWIALRVRSDNVAARRLYEGLAFTLLRDDGPTLELCWRRAAAQNE